MNNHIMFGFAMFSAEAGWSIDLCGAQTPGNCFATETDAESHVVRLAETLDIDPTYIRVVPIEFRRTSRGEWIGHVCHR